MWPSTRAAGSIFIRRSHRAPPRRRRRSPGSRAARRRVPASSSPVTSSVSVPPRSGEMWLELEVLDVDPLGAERLGDPGEHARAVGDVHPDALQRARRRRTRARASGGGSGRPRRSSGRGSRRRGARAPPRPARSGAGARRAPSRTASALSRKMSTQIRGFAPAIRVMSRSEPPAFASGSWPVDPASRRPGSTTTFASTCGSVARQRDEPVVRRRRRSRRASRRARRRSRGRRRCRSGSVVGRRRQEPGRARRRGRRAACSAPRDSEPQIGCPPTNRARAARGRDDARLGRADVGDGRPSPVAASTATTCVGQARRSARRRRTSVGAGDGLLERRGGASTRPALDRGGERVGVGVPAA